MVRNNLETEMRVREMETGCLEVVVNAKTNTLIKVRYYGAIILTVCFCLLAFLMHFAFAVLMIACAVLAYFSWLDLVVDYEYAYVDKEIRIAKIQQKQRRKEIAVYDLTKMEMMAPQGSSHLDEYRNRSLKVYDFSSGDDANKACRYELVMEGGEKVILDMIGEYADQIIHVIRNYYPRKVFTN